MSAQLILILLIVVLVISCDEVSRHRTLTFFFDGVPPLEREQSPIEKNLSTTGSQRLIRNEQQPEWYVHEPQKDCTTCHGRRRDRGFTRETLLLSPVPNLCYGCHTNYATSAPFVHGPVAVGQCLFCHNPHKSKIKHLLKETVPDLCYLCHDETVIADIQAHQVDQMSACISCHNPHVGSTKALLKNAPILTNRSSRESTPTNNTMQSNATEMETNQKDLSDKTETAQKTISGDNKLSQAFETALKLIEQGEVQLARKMLVDLKESMSLTQKEEESITRVIQQIDDAIAEKNEKINSNNISKQEQVPTIPGDNTEQLNEQKRQAAELYYKSLTLYRDGQLDEAREGFIQVLKSGLAPQPMTKTIYGYLIDIDNALSRRKTQPNR